MDHDGSWPAAPRALRVPEPLGRPALRKVDGGTGSQDKVDRDDDEPQEHLWAAGGDDSEESDGERYFAPASGKNGKEACNIGDEEDRGEVLWGNVGIVLAVADCGDDGEQGARRRKGKLGRVRQSRWSESAVHQKEVSPIAEVLTQLATRTASSHRTGLPLHTLQ